jgi:hypothetical protein
LYSLVVQEHVFYLVFDMVVDGISVFLFLLLIISLSLSLFLQGVDGVASLPSLSVCGRVTIRQTVAVPQAAQQPEPEQQQQANQGEEEQQLDPRKRRKKATTTLDTATTTTTSIQPVKVEDQDCVMLEWTSGTVRKLQRQKKFWFLSSH